MAMESDLVCIVLLPDENTAGSDESTDKSSDASIVFEEFMEEEKTGMKRKNEEEDSDSEYEETSSDEDEDEEEEDSDGDRVEIHDSDGNVVTDDQLMKWMNEDERPVEVKRALLNKIRKYLKSIDDSDGYECSHFPGHIWGLTTLEPRDMVIRKRDKYPEGYNHMMLLSSLAIQYYNSKVGTNYEVVDINKLCVSVSMCETFYITFRAREVTTEEENIFQAAVWDNTINSEIKILACRLKPTS